MLNDFLTALNDCVWAFDVNTQKYLFISPSVYTITGYHPKDFHQNTELWNEIIDQRDRDDILIKSAKIEGEEWTDLTYRIITKDGKTKWVHKKKRRTTDEKTGHEILFGVIDDVSYQKQVNFNLQE